MRPFLKSRYGLTMLPLILFLFVVVGLISAGYMMLGPKVQLGKTVETKAGLEKTVDAIISWSVANGRIPVYQQPPLPIVNELTAIIPNPLDAWGKSYLYLYDANLADITKGGLCGLTTTNIIANNVMDVAFVIWSGGEDYTPFAALANTLANPPRPAVPATLNSTTLASPSNISTYGPVTGTLTLTANDLFRVVTLEELKNRAGCYGSTQGRLRILNNELPQGCRKQDYSATVFGEGGVKNSSGTYTFTINGLPLGLSANAASISGVPTSIGNSLVSILTTDSYLPTANSVQKNLNLIIGPCLPTPAGAWDFNNKNAESKYGGAAAQGTIAGTVNVNSWVPRGGGFALYMNGTNNYIYFNDINYFNLGAPATNKIVVKGVAVGTPITTVAGFNALPVGDLFFPMALPAGKLDLDGQGTTTTPVTINAATGSYHFTDSTSISNNAIITNYTSNDDISIAGATAAQYDGSVISSDTTTGDVTINYVTANLTLSAWVNFSGRPTQSWCDPATKVDMAIGAIAGKGFLYPAIGYGMYVTQTRQCTSCTAGCGAWSNYKVAFQLRNPANTDIHYVTSDDAIAGGSWAHIVAVLDRNASPATDQIKMYINGVKQTDASNDYQYTAKTLLNFDNTFRFTIGARHDGGSGYGFPYWGYIDDVYFYKVALTDIQAENLYIATAIPFRIWNNSGTNRWFVYNDGINQTTCPTSSPVTDGSEFPQKLLPFGTLTVYNNSTCTTGTNVFSYATVVGDTNKDGCLNLNLTDRACP